MWKLQVFINGIEAASYELKGGRDYVLGRDPTAGLVVPDRSVSRRHCRITVQADGVEFVDLGAANGMRFRNAPVSRCVLHDGDEIHLGTTRLRLVSDTTHTGLLSLTDPTLGETTVPGAPGAEGVPGGPAPATPAPLESGKSAYRQLEHDRLAILVEAAKSLSASFDVKTLLQKIVHHLREIMTVHRAAIVLVEPDGSLRPAALHPETEVEDLSRICSQSIIRSVLDSRVGQIIDDAQKVGALSRHQSVMISNIRAAICVPMLSQDRVIGAIYADCPGLISEYRPRDLEFLTAFAGLAAVAIENATMHEQLRERERMNRELELAKQIQRGLLPPLDMETPGLEMDWAYIPARNQIGGDFYDVIAIEPGVFGILIGDVSGKSLPAALYMSQVVALVRACCACNRRPGEVFTDVNRILGQRLRESEDDGRLMYATAAFLVIDTVRGTVEWASAGHPAVQCLETGTGTCRELGSLDFFLGIAPEHSFASERFECRRGAIFTLYTDGILEARNRAGEQFGIGRIRAAVSAASELLPKEICRRIVSDVDAWVSGSPHTMDDIALMVVRLP